MIPHGLTIAGMVSPGPLFAWSWGEPRVLFWSLVVTVPVLIHLYGRLTIRRIDFPAVRFLPETAISRRSPDRLREILLLLLQCVAILLLVTAAAIPRWRSLILTESPVASRPPVCRIFVLDGSASMLSQDRTGCSSFDRAKRRIHEMLTEDGSEESANERFGLLMAGDPPELELGRLTPRRTEFLGRLDRLQCTRGEADLRGVFARLLQFLDDQTFLKPMERCEVIILSDLDAATWKGYDATRTPPSFLPEWTAIAAPLAERTSVHLVPVGDPPSENIGLTELQVETASGGTAAPETEPPRQVRVKLVSRGGLASQTVPVTLSVDGVVVERREVNVGPSESVPVEFDPVPIGLPSERPPVTETSTAGYGNPNRFSRVVVAKPFDRFPPDDQCQESIRSSEWLRLLLVNASSSPEQIRWLSAAIAPLGEVGPIRMTTVSLAEFPFTDLEPMDGIVLFDASTLPVEAKLVLRRYLGQGGDLLIFPGNAPQEVPASPVTEDAASSDWWPADVGELRDRPQTAFIRGESGGSDAGLFERFTGTSAAEVPLLCYRKLTPRRGSRTLWRSTEGDPLIVTSTVDSGRTLLWAFRPVPSESPLVVLPVFVPLIQETLRWLCVPEQRSQSSSEVLPIIPTAELEFRFLTHNPDFNRAIREQFGWHYGVEDSVPLESSAASESEVSRSAFSEPKEISEPNEISESGPESGPGAHIWKFFHSPTGARWLTPTKFLMIFAILFWLASLHRGARTQS